VSVGWAYSEWSTCCLSQPCHFSIKLKNANGSIAREWRTELESPRGIYDLSPSAPGERVMEVCFEQVRDGYEPKCGSVAVPNREGVIELPPRRCSAANEREALSHICASRLRVEGDEEGGGREEREVEVEQSEVKDEVGAQCWAEAAAKMVEVGHAVGVHTLEERVRVEEGDREEQMRSAVVVGKGLALLGKKSEAISLLSRLFLNSSLDYDGISLYLSLLHDVGRGEEAVQIAHQVLLSAPDNLTAIHLAFDACERVPSALACASLPEYGLRLTLAADVWLRSSYLSHFAFTSLPAERRGEEAEHTHYSTLLRRLNIIAKSDPSHLTTSKGVAVAADVAAYLTRCRPSFQSGQRWATCKNGCNITSTQLSMLGLDVFQPGEGIAKRTAGAAFLSIGLAFLDGGIERVGLHYLSTFSTQDNEVARSLIAPMLDKCKSERERGVSLLVCLFTMLGVDANRWMQNGVYAPPFGYSTVVDSHTEELMQSGGVIHLFAIVDYPSFRARSHVLVSDPTLSEFDTFFPPPPAGLRIITSHLNATVYSASVHAFAHELAGMKVVVALAERSACAVAAKIAMEVESVQRVIMRYNPATCPPLSIQGLMWEKRCGAFCGCSLFAAAENMATAGFFLSRVELDVAVFDRAQPQMSHMTTESITNLYLRGFFLRPDKYRRLGGACRDEIFAARLDTSTLLMTSGKADAAAAMLSQVVAEKGWQDSCPSPIRLPF